MITGFNTDIEFQGKTYHVQTEDKGLARPILLSLVYDGGTILASKRAPYDDLLIDEFDEAVLSERLQKQHRTICAAIRAGRLEDLKRMTEREAAKTTGQEFASTPSVGIPKPDRAQFDIPLPSRADGDSDPSMPIPMPKVDDADDVSNLPLVEEYAVIEDEIIIPDEAIEIVSEMMGKERPTNTRLTIELIGDSKFKGGKRCSVGVMVCRGSGRKVIGDAQVMVKILGSAFRPLIYHARTDANGIAILTLQFPSFSEGRAALMVRAVSDGEEVELRRVVSHG
ncbi:MAG: hypothetical protein KIT61_01895 [Pyrinomonadaceae bacterium]|nr:hypothetical protein [Blastocatellia bacterium]MCW5955307.1 hypothetical protein [Pyrinomonadaceae bacterium]